MADDFEETLANAKGNLPAEAAGLSEGAKAFARQYMSSDDDSGCIASFEKVNEYKPAKSKAETERTGQAIEIFEDVVYIRINIRGSNLREVHRPVRDEDKRRFPYAWQEYMKGEKACERGTPLQMLGIDIPIIRHLAAVNVFTIEDMALVSDNNLQHLGLGSRELRKRAQEYVDTQNAAKLGKEKTVELDVTKDLVATQSQQLAQALAAIERLTEENKKLAEKRGPGRPRKEDSEAA